MQRIFFFNSDRWGLFVVVASVAATLTTNGSVNANSPTQQAHTKA